MAISAIRIGSPVYANDGDYLGDVTMVLYDEASGVIDQIVADKGMFDKGRVIDLHLIENATSDGIELNINRETAEGLTKVNSQTFAQFRSGVNMPSQSGVSIGTGGSDQTWAVGGTTGGDMPSTGQASLFMVAPTGNVVTEVFSTLDPNDIRIDEGTEVIGSDGDKIGEVEQVFIGPTGRPETIGVKAGFLFHHDVLVPVEWIAGASNKHLRLNVTSKYAEEHQDEITKR